MAAATALAFSSVIAGGLGFAGPADAEPVMTGVYTYQQEGLAPQTWSIYPTCVPTVGDLREPLELAVACNLHVEASSGTKGAEILTRGGTARLTGGLWTYSTSAMEGMHCPDGSTASVTDTYKFDDVKLTGTRSVAHNADCGLAPGIETVPFTLTYQKPLPLPVTTYPLDCEPGGLRWCT